MDVRRYNKILPSHLNQHSVVEVNCVHHPVSFMHATDGSTHFCHCWYWQLCAFYVIVWGTLHVKRYTKKLSLFWAKFCLWRNCFTVTRACRSQTCFNQDPVACSQMISWKWQREEESKGRSSMIDKWEDLVCFLEEVLESWNTPPWWQGHTKANIL
jgi:hypothetical protein